MNDEPTREQLADLLASISADWRDLTETMAETHRLEKQAIVLEGYLARLNDNKQTMDFLKTASAGVAEIHEGLRSISREIKETEREKTRDEARTELLREQLDGLQNKLISIASGAIPTHQAPSPAPVAINSPTVASVYASFIEQKSGSVSQAMIDHFNATYGVFCKIVPPVAEIHRVKRADASLFISLLRQLPNTFGKSSSDRAKSIEAIIREAQARDADYRTLSEKTLRRHVHTLSAIWKYASGSGIVPHSHEFDIWTGHLISPLREQVTKRRQFTANELGILQSTRWTARISLNTIRQIVAIASYTGMRLEEICRLRPMDIYPIDGVICFHIRVHKDSAGRTIWDPKTDAGERIIPLHSYILAETGIVDRATRCTAGGYDRVFHGLKMSLRHQTYGDSVSKAFGRWKTRAGFPAEVTFHSFRHLFRTALGHRADGKHHPTEWIDQIMGHENPGEGSRYNAGTNPRNLKRLVDSVRYEGWNPMHIS